MQVVIATPKVKAAIIKASNLPGIKEYNGKASANLKYKEDEQNIELTPISSDGGVVLVKILSKANNLVYNVEVYPFGINGEHTYNAKLFFGDKCWSSDVPSGTFIVANQINVEKIGG